MHKIKGIFKNSFIVIFFKLEAIELHRIMLKIVTKMSLNSG